MNDVNWTLLTTGKDWKTAQGNGAVHLQITDGLVTFCHVRVAALRRERQSQGKLLPWRRGG